MWTRGYGLIWVCDTFMQYNVFLEFRGNFNGQNLG